MMQLSTHVLNGNGNRSEMGLLPIIFLKHFIHDSLLCVFEPLRHENNYHFAHN